MMADRKLVCRSFAEPSVFPEVGSENVLFAEQGKESGGGGDIVERIRINNEWIVSVFHQRLLHLARGVVGRQPRAYGNGGVAREIGREAVDAVGAAGDDHCFGHGSLEDDAVTLRRADGEQTYAAAQGCLCCHNGCPCHTLAAGNEQPVSVSALMAFRVAGRNKRLSVGERERFQNYKLGIRN